MNGAIFEVLATERLLMGSTLDQMVFKLRRSSCLDTIFPGALSSDRALMEVQVIQT